MIWTKSKINYAFVFEYDTRHTLEWRQLLEVCPMTRALLWPLSSNETPDPCLFHVPIRPFHVAQFFMDQYHVHILACRINRSICFHCVLASTSAASSESEMVGLFKREFRPICHVSSFDLTHDI